MYVWIWNQDESDEIMVTVAFIYWQMLVLMI
jgi:hypothetical protein